MVDRSHLPGDAGELPRGILVVHSGAALDAAAELSGIEDVLPDHLEDVALKDMRGRSWNWCSVRSVSDRDCSLSRGDR